MNRRRWLFISTLLCLSLSIPSRVKADGIFTYQNGTFTTINNSASDTPLGIDNAGDLLLATGGSNSPLFLLSGGTSVPITLGPGYTAGYGISGNGTILGSYTWTTKTYFTDLGGSITSLSATTSNLAFFTGINDEGQIIGASVYAGSPPVVYNLNTGTATAISFPGAATTNLLSINDNGEILGAASGNVNFVYDAGTFTTFTLPAGCRPKDMNDNEQIVGNCYIAGVFHGFLDNSGTLTYIDYNRNSNENYTLVTGINDSGEILGSFFNIPEPSALVQLATGLACLMGLWLCMYFAQKRKLHAPSSQPHVALASSSS